MIHLGWFIFFKDFQQPGLVQDIQNLKRARLKNRMLALFNITGNHMGITINIAKRLYQLGSELSAGANNQHGFFLHHYCKG